MKFEKIIIGADYNYGGDFVIVLEKDKKTKIIVVECSALGETECEAKDLKPAR